MRYDVDFTTAAARQIRKMPRPVARRILDAIQRLQLDPRPRGARKSVGERTAWRIRVGEYQVIYDVVDESLTVTVVRAAHRREVYDN